jgi:cell wall-associated NlpC family hydrolase
MFKLTLLSPLLMAAVATAAPAPPAGEAASAPQAAASATASDPVLQLLQARGLLRAVATTAADRSPPQRQPEATPQPAFVRQLRDGASELVLQAMNFLGVPYRLGGNTAEQGFDCSGFTRFVFENSIGLVLPRRADQQARLGGLLPIKREDLRPGDLVFFNTMRRAFSHVGIYVGEGQFIHAPHTGGEVRVEDMRLAYWSRRFNGARRAEQAAPPPTAAEVDAPSPGTPAARTRP